MPSNFQRLELINEKKSDDDIDSDVAAAPQTRYQRNRTTTPTTTKHILHFIA